MAKEDKVWHVGSKGERKGPFAVDEVNGMIAGGEVTASDVAWKEGMEDWKPLGQIEDFTEAVKNAPPPPPAPAGGPNPFAVYFQNFWANLKAIVTKPDEGLAATADKRDVCFQITWIVLGILVFAFLCLQRSLPLAVQGWGTADAKMFHVLGPEPQATSGELVSRGTMFLKGLLHGVIIYAIYFGILMLTLVPVLKSQAKWQDALSILGLASIPTAAIGLLMFAFIWIDPFFFILAVLAAALHVLFFYHVFVHVSKVTRRAALYAVPGVYFVSLLVGALLRLAMK